jgi:uncharacterized protein
MAPHTPHAARPGGAVALRERGSHIRGIPMKAIKITAGAVSVAAELNDSRTAAAIAAALPIQARGQTWGDEIYFDIGLALAEEAPREVVELGDLGYWPPGQAFCIFFGPTPMSRGNEIRPASAVNVIGRVVGDPRSLKSVRSGARVTIEAS